jgi:predicted acylesterase/phospholipase RssA
MIYTFYSYKGGVGRSMALANVAECFCEKGLRVLIVDWDLEAPGLESFFFEPKETSKEETVDEAGSIRSRLGVIDMLLSYKQIYPRLPLAAPPPSSPSGNSKASDSITDAPVDVGKILDEYLPPLSDFVTPIRSPTGTDSSGELWLLGAGWRQNRFADYARAVQSFDWDGFYRSFDGEAYFDWMRRQFSGFDVVLIDSRTGVTEMGGVCARQLADVVVSFCAPNFQNIDGVARMVRSFNSSEVIEARKNRPVDTVVVPARIELTESHLLERFQELFYEQVEKRSEFLPQVVSKSERPLWDLHIPYIPRFAFLERRVVGPNSETDPTGHLPKAYWRLATQLAALTPPNNPARRRFAVEIRQNFPHLHFGVLLAFVGDGGRVIADRVSNYLRSANIEVFDQIDRNSGQADISLAIENAESLAVVMTPELVTSDKVRRDIRIAHGAGRSVFGIDSDSLARDSLPSWLKNAAIIQSDDKEGIVNRLGQRRTAERIPMMAPELPGDAILREPIISELKSAVEKHAIVALLGQVGSGKTLLASQFCCDDDVVDAFPGGILWLRSGPSGNTLADRRALYAAFFGQAEEYDDSRGADRLAKRLLGSRHLLVIDDAEKTKAVEEIIRLNASGVCLVATRNAGVASGLASCIVKVGSFTGDEAAGLIGRALDHEGETAPGNLSYEIAEVVSQLGAWPAAIHLASVVLRQRIREGSQPDEALMQIARSIETHGVLAFDQAARALGRPPLAPLLRAALAILNPTDRRNLATLAEFGENATVEDAAELWGLSKRQSNNLLRRFGAMSLLSYDEADETVNVAPPIASYLHPPQARTVRRQISSSLDRQENPDVLTAISVLCGTTRLAFDDLVALFRSLKAARYFDLARHLVAPARELPEARNDPARTLWLVQQHALCTYKDPDLPADQRLDQALTILKTEARLGDTDNQETLGLAGAIFKRKWEVDGQRENLERSLAYYRRGYQQGVLKDDGYTGINAAFILDLLASREEAEAISLGIVATNPTVRREEARKIREEIAKSLADKVEKQQRLGKLENAWFLLGTLGEANFGLGRYDESLFWLREALEHQPADWEYETTARQLAEIARLRSRSQHSRDAVDAEAWSTLTAFLGDDAAAASSVSIGKVGLSLSGGGFRASLFHVGVLARLAECDLLRHIEVLSCVSGGSIVGAYYYLELRHLLQTKADSEITRDDYVELVKRMADNFLAGVQRNLRCRLMAATWANFKMALAPDYSTTRRLGELFEQELYARVEDGENLPRWLNQLTIEPKGEASDFAPKLDNWRRTAKVPTLILNATTLNTGHNWQFTASWMGETPTSITSEIDANDRLRRLYYWQAPEPYQRVSLGHAVAASACVPGLFEPLALAGLYPDRIVHLVDGGVHDNQGIGGLLEQDCVIFLVSDASGQMQTINRPRSELVDVPLRANNILMARVRDAEFRELEARRRSSLIRGLMFVHLKKDLDTTPIDWIGAQTPGTRAGEGSIGAPSSLTFYGIDKSVQNRLAAIRTDLDSFNDIEAFALMASGYLMTKAELPRALKSVDGMPSDGPPADWRFLDLQEQLAGRKERGRAGEHFTRVLEVGCSKMFKAFRLAPFRSTLVLMPWLALAVVAGLALYQLGRLLPSSPDPQIPEKVALLVGGLLIWGISLFLARRKSLTQFFIGLMLGTFGWIGRLHLVSTDRLYRRLGSVTATKLTDIFELAKQYDRVRAEMASGAARTRRMSAIFDAMTAQANGVRRFLPELQASKSPGRRLAAIAVLYMFPRADQLDWLATRLDPESEKPFVGYQAAAALLQAVRTLPGSDAPKLFEALGAAKRLADLSPDDPPRTNMLATAQKELARRYPQGEQASLSPTS